MLEIFSSLLTGVLSGGATGLIGILIQRYFESQTKKLDIEIVKLNHANTLELAKLESARAAARDATELAVADRSVEAVRLSEDGESLRAAMEYDRAAYVSADSLKSEHWTSHLVTVLFGLVDTFRGLVRPSMTVYLCGLVTVMFFWVRELAAVHGVTLTPTQIHELMLQIITTILYVFTTVSLFWFGSRGPAKK